MKINDIAGGALFLILALALGLGAWNLPNPGEQIFGPATFPLVIASLLALCAIILLAGRLRSASHEPLFAWSDWTRRPWLVVRFLLVPMAVFAYVSFVELLGFLPTAVAILLCLFLSGHVRPAPAALLSICVALLVHTIFYVGLSVQLPWGILDPVRW
ncbi:tripartite tricarboxylate transporter TctB family protein [Microvirga yunnanensis]|uniref:tripartite tricarboxylate transporter TctB family protein n=1 Tax=Microvirga yunnanensis TaxID=2953740 RepID=UPI0021C80002|nr:tripartite tricarboxylate transporter TctB family protein [Microvirga sp. HBU65207]